ncbi:MAG: hypothetical protein V3V33_14345 [Candidatus Lokiarchaeia archaeon]
MSKMDPTSIDSKSPYIENRKKEQDILKRYCGNCKKEYSFIDAMKRCPELIQDSITALWKNPEVKFYCSYCYLLKLIKLLKKKN